MTLCERCGHDGAAPHPVGDLYTCNVYLIEKQRLEIEKLKKSVESWKDAWYDLRWHIGDIWWWRHKQKQAWQQLQQTHRTAIKLLFEAARDRDRLLAGRLDFKNVQGDAEFNIEPFV